MRLTGSAYLSDYALMLLMAAAISGPAQVAAERHHHASITAPAQTGYTRRMQSLVIPDITVLGVDGERTSLVDELDHDQAVILNFIFTTCRAICPVMTGTFAAVQKQLGNEVGRVRMISISIDPEHDTPDTLLNYSKQYSRDANWRFFTGTLADVIAVQNAFDVYRGNKMNHVPVTFLRASRNTPWLRIEGFANADSLIQEYHRLLYP